MITKEELLEFARSYQDSLEKYQELTDRLLMPCNREKWFELLEERSCVIRETFRRNEEWFPRIYGEMKHMTLEQAGIFLHVVENVFLGGCEDTDFPLVIDMAESAMPVYEQLEDFKYIIDICSMLSFFYLSYYDNMLENEDKGEALKYAEKVISYSRYYGDMKELNTRMDIWVNYGIMLNAIPTRYDIPFETVAGWYDDMMALWESDTVQKLDGAREEIVEVFKAAQSMFMSFCYATMVNLLKTSEKKDYKRCVEQIEKKLLAVFGKIPELDINLNKCRQVLDVVNGRVEPNELIYQTMAVLDEWPEINIVEGGYDSYNENKDLLFELLMTVEFLASMLYMATFDKKEKQSIVRIMIRLVLQKMQGVPRNFASDDVNRIYAQLFCDSLYFLESFSEKEDVLEKLIISRQPLTFVHGCMVERLAVMLAEGILAKQPALLAGIPDYETVEELLGKKEEFLVYVGKCGAFHDIGKCEVAGVINMQTHKVTDKEFRCIKRHPHCGVRALEKDVSFEPFIHVILGHHRTYDGMRGYPENFDILSSPYKPVIDLISICDSLDAATDHLGRNYNKAKSFDTVLEEFKQGAGTRYNPDMVRIIEEDVGLQERLRYLVTDGRAEAYYEAYQKCQSIAEMAL